MAETTEPPDAEIAQAFEENQVVMYVQVNFDYSTVIAQHPYSLPTLLSQ